MEVKQTEFETLIDLYTLVNQTCTISKSTVNNLYVEKSNVRLSVDGPKVFMQIIFAENPLEATFQRSTIIPICVVNYNVNRNIIQLK